MTLPNYRDGSIVNLMQSVRAGLGRDGGTVTEPYGTLAELPPEELRTAENVVLLVIDGLGYEYLRDAGRDGALGAHLRGAITSVFPSTTASAITSFLTGRAPQQHALTGWFVWFKEVGQVVAPLPFTTRVGDFPLTKAGVEPRSLLDTPGVFDDLRRPAFLVQRQDLVDSSYTRAHRGAAGVRGYRSLPELFEAVRRLVRSERRSYIYAYWPELDALSHVHGSRSARVRAHFHDIDAAFGQLLDDLAGTGTVVVVCADHGFVDTEPDTRLRLSDHPRLAETLVVPLCGEPRVVFCYVDPAKREIFEGYVRDELGPCCEAVPSSELVERGYFGLGRPHPRLADRIGHYALLMKGSYVLRDRLVGERRKHEHVGVHGGTSSSEMLVPLVVARCD